MFYFLFILIFIVILLLSFYIFYGLIYKFGSFINVNYKMGSI